MGEPTSSCRSTAHAKRALCQEMAEQSERAEHKTEHNRMTRCHMALLSIQIYPSAIQKHLNSAACLIYSNASFTATVILRAVSRTPGLKQVQQQQVHPCQSRSCWRCQHSGKPGCTLRQKAWARLSIAEDAQSQARQRT